MPLPLALPFALLVGGSLAWLARAELARSEVPLLLSRPFLVALAFGLLVLAPVLGWFSAFHGDWAHLYLVDTSRVPSAVDLVVVLALASLVPASFAVGAPLAVARRSTRLLQLGGGIAVAGAITCAVAARRLGVSATTAQWAGGFGLVAIGQSPLGRAVLSSWIALALGYAWAVLAMRSGKSSS
jgi:hypothetical protein